MKHAIYESQGEAKEYCELALNHFLGCTHGCLYCSSPKVLHISPEKFRESANPRLTPAEIIISAASMEGDGRPVFLSFVSDPYQPEEKGLQLTREVIKILHDYDHPVTILTKGGELAQRDFDLFGPGDSFGVTLTFQDENKSRYWEPGAALPNERLANLMEAKARGIPTWVSLEPVIEPLQTLACIHASAPWVNHYKIGKLNYYPSQTQNVSWTSAIEEFLRALRYHKNGFYIKKSLSSYIGYPEGYKEGLQLPIGKAASVNG